MIGDFMYVLENIIVEQNQACWQCEIVGCHGRCRTTYDFVLVAGPTPHSCRASQAAARLDLPASASQTGTSSTAEDFDRQSTGQKVFSNGAQGAGRGSGEAIAPKEEADCDAVYYPQVILNERSSPSAAVSGVHGGAFGDSGCGRTPPAPMERQLRARHGPIRKLVWCDGEQVPEAGPSHRNAGSSAVPGEPQLKEACKGDSTAEEPEVIDLVESNDDEICEEEQESVDAGYDGHSDESDGQDSSSEQERVETKLLETELRIEVLRRKLIERRLQSLVSKKRRGARVAPSTHEDE